MKLLTFLSIFAIYFCDILCQPAAIYVPLVFNGTHIISANNSTNYTRNNTNNVPVNSTNFNNYGSASNSCYGCLYIGNIGPYDRRIFSNVYFKEARWWTNREKIIEYPNDLGPGYGLHATITAIRVTNLYYDGRSATATLLKGGVGTQYAKIQLQSNWNKGFKFLVELYGQV